MFKRSFVSLYFLPDKLLAFQLSSNKKKVKKYASSDLPEGLIEGSRVRDIDALAQILKGVWKNFHIEEKSVGIILPESSTFTKTLEIPKLKTSELNEAIRWQAQEYFPAMGAEQILDWKIVGRTNTEIEVLLVAVDLKVLRGYVDSAEAAGLFPLAVEIPSVCLARFAKKDESGNLIIYKDSSQTLLVLVSGEKIIGTSVLRSRTSEEIKSTASRMLAHYRQVEIESILVGGEEISEEFRKDVTEAFKVKIVPISPDVKGIISEELQKYLVPFSMQLTDLAEPLDPNSLNLLPPHLVEKYKRQRLRLQVWGLTLTITLFVWFSFLAVLGSYLFMAQEIDTLKAKNSSKVGSDATKQELVSQIQDINSISQKLLSIKEISAPPQKIINEIYKSKPAGVSIEALELDFDKGVMRISGIAATREVLIDFKNNLELTPDFVQVTIPISNFEKEENLEFNLSFNYAPVTSKIAPKRPAVKIPEGGGI